MEHVWLKSLTDAEEGKKTQTEKDTLHVKVFSRVKS